MSQNWFYADAQNQQQGPVAAGWLANAYRDGTVTADTLVWREGLSGWVRLASVASQLGLVIVGAAAPPPNRSVPTAGGKAVKQPSSSSTWVIVLIVVLFGGVAVLAIVAAVAIPAYLDYTVRAKLSQALVAGNDIREKVGEFRAVQKRCPDNGEGGIESATDYATPVIASIEVGKVEQSGDCAITITLAPVTRALAGKQIQWTLDSGGDWHTTSDVDRRLLPIWMRNSLSND